MPSINQTVRCVMWVTQASKSSLGPRAEGRKVSLQFRAETAQPWISGFRFRMCESTQTGFTDSSKLKLVPAESEWASPVGFLLPEYVA